MYSLLNGHSEERTRPDNGQIAFLRMSVVQVYTTYKLQEKELTFFVMEWCPFEPYYFSF
jgi:hypothetical protein